MASRRDQFRRQLRQLESAGGPQKAIEAGFYVARPHAGERLARRIELNPIATRVIAGPVGSGKSTELQVVAATLNELQDMSSFVVDVSLVHDLSDLREGSLIAAAGICLEQQGLKSRELSKLRKAAYGEDTLATLGAKIANAAYGVDLRASEPSASTWMPNRGILRAPGAETEVARRLAEYLRAALDSLTAVGESTTVFLFDSLDRVDDPDGFRTVLERDAAVLREYGFGTILTAPIKTLWSNSADFRLLCESWDTLPYEDPATSSTANSFFSEVLHRRLDPDLFPSKLQPRLVHASGGVLRDLIDMARSAVEEAYMCGHDHVTAEDIEASISRFARGLSLGLGSADVSRLLRVRDSRQVSVFDDLTLDLLESRQILEHHDSESGSYFEPHPALRAFLEHYAKAS